VSKEESHKPRKYNHLGLVDLRTRQTPGQWLQRRNVQRFRGGLVFKAHRLLYHSTLGLRVIKKKKKMPSQWLQRLHWSHWSAESSECEWRVHPLRGPLTGVQGYLAHKKQPPPLGPPYGPRHSPNVGSYSRGVGVFLWARYPCIAHWAV